MLSHALVTLTPGTLLSAPNGEEGSGTQNLSDPSREDNKKSTPANIWNPMSW